MSSSFRLRIRGPFPWFARSPIVASRRVPAESPRGRAGTRPSPVRSTERVAGACSRRTGAPRSAGRSIARVRRARRSGPEGAMAIAAGVSPRSPVPRGRGRFTGDLGHVLRPTPTSARDPGGDGAGVAHGGARPRASRRAVTRSRPGSRSRDRVRSRTRSLTVKTYVFDTEPIIAWPHDEPGGERVGALLSEATNDDRDLSHTTQRGTRKRSTCPDSRVSRV